MTKAAFFNYMLWLSFLNSLELHIPCSDIIVVERLGLTWFGLTFYMTANVTARMRADDTHICGRFREPSLQLKLFYTFSLPCHTKAMPVILWLR